MRGVRARWGLAALFAAAAALLLWESRGQSFYGDEWDFFADYGGWGGEVLLRPDSGALVLGPVLAYKALIGVFGGDTYVPERLAWIALVLLGAGLFYSLARPRIGAWGALVPTGLLLVLGASGELAAGPSGIAIYGAVAAGLAALLLVRRRDFAGDLAACLALAASISFDLAGLAFAVAVAVEVLTGPRRPGGAPVWVFGVPAVLYGGWWLWAQEFDQTALSLEGLLTFPLAIGESLAAVSAAIAGTFRSRDVLEAGEFHSAAGWVIAVAALAAAGAALGRRGGLRLDARLTAAIALPLAYWTLVGIGIGPSEDPESARYLYPGAVMVLLAAVEVVSRIEPPRAVLAVLAGFLVLGAMANLSALRDNASFLRAQGESNRAQLAALELVAAGADRSRQIEPLDPSSTVGEGIEVTIGAYLSSAAARGSPAFDPASLPGRGGEARARADLELVHALALAPAPAPAAIASGSQAPPRPQATDRAAAAASGRCTLVRPQQPGGTASFGLPAGGGLVLDERGGASMLLAVRRFGDEFSAHLPAPPPGGPVRVEVPRDASPVPWSLQLTTSSPVRVCAG